MLPVILSSAPPVGAVLDFFSPAFSSLDWLAVASSAALVFWGLFLGLWIGSRIAKARKGDSISEPSPEKSEVPESKESVESPLIGELAESRKFCELQAEELEFLQKRFAEVGEQGKAREERLAKLAAQIGESPPVAAVNGLIDPKALQSARLPVLHLSEAIQTEAERRDSDSDRLVRLETRLREESERLDSGSHYLAEVRTDLEGQAAKRPDDAALKGAVDRFARVDDQLRSLQQNVSGCAARLTSGREHVDTERKKLASAAESIAAAESLLSQENADPENVSAVLSEAGEKLSHAKAGVSELRGDLDQELDEMDGRIEWVVRESPSGFLKAVEALNEADSGAHPGVTLMQSDAWKRLGELKGSLAGLSLTLESGLATKAPATGGKKQLVTAADRAVEAIEEATQSSPAEAEVGEDKPKAPADLVAPIPIPAAPSEELETLRFSMAARDGEIAKLKRQLAEREAELEEARAEKTEQSKKESLALPIPATSGMNPVSARLAPVPVKRAEGDPGATGPASSRQFLRRLLGIGNSRRNAATPALVETGRPQNGIAVPAATLVEARAALTQLRGRPAEEPAEVPGGNGAHEAEGNSTSDDDADLRAVLAESGSRIAELEAEVAALRHAAAVAEIESKTRAESAGEWEIPGEIGSEAAGVTRLAGADDTENEACQIGAGESVPVVESERVIFRGLDPALWNSRTETEVLDEEDSEMLAGFSLPLDEVPERVEFLRLRRLDTGESVVASINRETLLAGGNAKARRGWSGRGEKYFGASHLGLFDESLPREVETKFGAGGWGFGHRESIGSGQAYAWAGKALEDPGEGFEISVGPLPEGAKIEPLEFSSPVSSLSLFSELEEEEASAIEPELPLPITAATVAAAIAESASHAPEISWSEEPNEASEPIVEPEAVPSHPEPEPEPDPQLDALTHQADNRMSGLVLFRANDPSLWGSEVFSGANRRARSLAQLPTELAFLRMRRMDTREGVVVPITSAALTDDGDGQPRGFNGSNETFYGAYHLGIFDESLPQDVETRFTYGGWGFGHSVLGPEQQACGWEGRVIAPDTVFEIAVFTRMPVLEELDRLVEA